MKREKNLPIGSIQKAIKKRSSGWFLGENSGHPEPNDSDWGKSVFFCLGEEGKKKSTAFA